eukprot:PhF_6_TR10102/c0_g1_i1/m.15720
MHDKAIKTLRKHILLKSPCTLRSVLPNLPCYKWCQQQYFTTVLLNHLDGGSRHVGVHRSRTSHFGHFTEERIELPAVEAVQRSTSIQLDGYWYYLSSPLPPSIIEASGIFSFFRSLNVAPLSTLKCNLWHGIAAHTATHNDGNVHNVFLQLDGSKEVAFIGPQYSCDMEDLGDMGKPCASGRSLFSDPHEHMVYTVLNPGDVLYLPPHYWHEFRMSCKHQPTTSITCWFTTSRQ